MNEPTAEELAQAQTTRLKEEQKVDKLKQIIEIKLKEMPRTVAKGLLSKRD